MVGILFCTRAKKPKGTPQEVQESIGEILQDLESQVLHYIRLVPTIRKFINWK